ncbi:MAG: alpha/beta hydrolase [Trichloromonas sp.]|nr:alpha/beta hydrolase [Trichloromonas sp.]
MTDERSVLVHVLVDGRRLGYAEYGTLKGRPVFYFHGFPGSRLEAVLADAAAARLEIRLIAVDRPGYGRSDDLPGRRLGDWPKDVAALAAALGLGKFGILGVSGGAPFALACAAAFPERVKLLSLVCPLGPLGDPSLSRQLPWPMRGALLLSHRFPGFSRWLGGGLLRLACRYPEGVLRALLLAAPPQDRALFRDADILSAMVQSLRQALSQRGRGVSADLAIYHEAWDFPLSELDLPVRLWHGTADRTVPRVLVDYLAASLPQCRLRLIPGEGHFSLPLRNMEEILADHRG